MTNKNKLMCGANTEVKQNVFENKYIQFCCLLMKRAVDALFFISFLINKLFHFWNNEC